MKRNWSLWLGILMLGFMLFLTYVGPHLSFVDATPPEHRMRFYENGELGRAPFPPSKEDWLGTDREARDNLSLIILGAKDTVEIIVLITIIRYLIAIPLAFLASTKKGIAYLVTNGWYSLFGSIPTIFAAILLLEILPAGMVYNTIDSGVAWKVLLIALFEVGRVSYLFANELYDVSKKEYVEASVTVGSNPFQLSIMHYLPTITQSLIVNFFLDLGRVTLLLGQLALFEYFVKNVMIYEPGGGVFFVESLYYSNTGVYDWPGLLSVARYEVMKADWIPFFPALALTLLMLTFMLLGEGLRKQFDKSSSSVKNKSVTRLFERVGEIFVVSKIPVVAIIVVLVGFVGFFIANGIEKKAEVVNGEEEVFDEIPVEVDEEPPEEEEPSEDEETGSFEGGKYIFENGKTIAKTESTTLLGGHLDTFAFVEQHMEKLTDRDFETEAVHMYCRSIKQGRCEQPIFTLKQPAPSVEAAYELIKGHLSTDVMLKKEFQLSETEYVYNMSSQLLMESYQYVYWQAEEFSLTFITENETISKITLEFGRR